MIVETVDKNSGAILFKKDEESLTLEKLLVRVEFLEKEVTKLKKRVSELEKASK